MFEKRVLPAFEVPSVVLVTVNALAKEVKDLLLDPENPSLLAKGVSV